MLRANAGTYQPLNAGTANGFGGTSRSTRSVDMSRSSPAETDDPSTNNEVIIICVFPLPSKDDLEDDEDDFISDPLTKARQIFWLKQDHGSVNTTDAGFPEFQDLEDGKVAGTTYRAVCRRKFLEVCQYCSTGLDASTAELSIDCAFPDSDNTEYFIAFSLPNKGKAMEELAAKFSYPMPYNKLAYEQAGGNAQVMKNSDGEEVLGYCLPGDHTDSSRFQPFRNTDCIRLFDQQLTKWVNKDEMCDQKVMLRWFYPEMKKERTELQQKWGRLWRFWQCPPKATGGTLLEVRNYFGEEIAFFYYMFAHVIWFLWPFALLSIIFAADQKVVSGYPMSQNTSDASSKKGVFAAILIIATSIFTAKLGSTQQRAIQSWGMTNYTMTVTVRQAYDPNQPAWKAIFWKWFAQFVLGLYMLFIVIANIALSHAGEYIGWPGISTKCVTVGMLGLKIMWTPIARILTNRENQRREEAWNESFALKLAVVQIFNVMLPFVMAGFGAQYVMAQCRPRADWEGDPFAPLLNVRFFRPLPRAVEDRFFEWWQGSEEPKWDCLSGCLPLDQDPNSKIFQECLNKTAVHGISDTCATTCESNLYSLSIFYYVSYVGIDLAFVVLAYFMVAYYNKTVNLEAKEDETEDDKRARFEYQGNLLEYKTGSWAGSFIEDSIEIGLLIAPVLCFAIIEPKIIILCTITCLILYRTMAWKMFVLVCRPYPKPATGLGIWLSILTFIGYLAVSVQVAFFVYTLHPMRSWPPAAKAAMFIGLEHSILVIAICFRPIFTETPKDVEDVEDMILVVRRDQTLAEYSGKSQSSYEKINWDKEVNPRLLQHDTKATRETNALKMAMRGLTHSLDLDAESDEEEETDEEEKKCVVC